MWKLWRETLNLPVNENIYVKKHTEPQRSDTVQIIILNRIHFPLCFGVCVYVCVCIWQKEGGQAKEMKKGILFGTIE